MLWRDPDVDGRVVQGTNEVETSKLPDFGDSKLTQQVVGNETLAPLSVGGFQKRTLCSWI